MDITDQARKDFFKSVEQHEMKIRMDAGVHRNIRFGRPESSTYYFCLATWPGHLCISGDMGCYVFSRTYDMFEFFRGKPAKGNEIRINPGYWAEKCQSQDKYCGIKKFSPEKFCQEIVEWVCDSMDVEKLDDLPGGLTEDLELDVLSRAHDGEYPAIEAALNFRWKGNYLFQNFFEVDCREYDHGYLWCLYAIVWGIGEYDRVKQRLTSGSNPARTG